MELQKGALSSHICMCKLVVCLQHEVQVSMYGCDVNLSLFLYLQMHTFEKISTLYVQQCNGCWNQNGNKSLQ